MSMFTDPCTDTYQRCLPKKWAANATHEFKSVQILQPVWLHRLLSFPDTALRLGRASLRIYLSGCARIHIQPFIFSLFSNCELDGKTQNERGKKKYFWEMIGPLHLNNPLIKWT